MQEIMTAKKDIKNREEFQITLGRGEKIFLCGHNTIYPCVRAASGLPGRRPRPLRRPRGPLGRGEVRG